MAEVNNARDQREDVKHEEPAKTKGELVARNAASPTPFGIPQATFAEQMKQGFPGMINRMVDYNAVTRSAEGANIPACRAVSQSAVADISCVLGGTLAQFLGITILDPTNIFPVGTTIPDGGYAQYMNVGVLTKGEIFATATVATASGDPVHFDTATGVLTNTGVIGPVVGARWKHTRLANELNVIQLGIQR